MLKVFRVEFEVTTFQSLMVDLSDAEYRQRRSRLLLDGKPKGERWMPPPVYSENPLLPRPDLWALWGVAGLAISTQERAGIAPLLAACGELLPLPFGEEVLELCNVTSVVDCLDNGQSVRRRSGVIEKYEFVPHRLPEVPLFKIPDTAIVELLCCESGACLDLEFKSVVTELDLKGVRFVELWRG